MEAATINYTQTHPAEDFTVITKQQAITVGLLGLSDQSVGMECSDRLGDLIVLPRHNWMCRQQVTSEERLSNLVGIHGGLNRAEMLSPFLAYRF